MASREHHSQTIKSTSFIMMTLMITAIFNLPYDYYIFLRVATLIGSGIVALTMYTLDKFENPVIFGSLVILILWNPIIPFYMDKSSWIVFNLAAAGYFGYLFYK